MKRQPSKSLVTLGLAKGGDRRAPGERRRQPLGEVAQRVISEAAGKGQSAAGGRTRQPFNAGEARTAQELAHEQSPEQDRRRNAGLSAAIARRLKIPLQPQTLLHILLETTWRGAFHRPFCRRHRASSWALAAKTSATASLN